MYSTKNYIQSPGINNNGKECVKNKHIYVHNRVTLLYSRNWHYIINQLRCCCCSLIIKLCPALCDPMDCSSQALLCVGFILQARTQEWISFSFSRESSCPGNWTHVSCIASGFFTIWAREANQPYFNLKKKKRVFKKWITWIITGARFKSTCVAVLPSAIWKRHNHLPFKHYFIRRWKDHSGSDSPKAWGATWDGVSHTPPLAEDLAHEPGKQLCLLLHQLLQLPLDLVFQLWVLIGVCVSVCVCVCLCVSVSVCV